MFEIYKKIYLRSYQTFRLRFTNVDKAYKPFIRLRKFTEYLQTPTCKYALCHSFKVSDGLQELVTNPDQYRFLNTNQREIPGSASNVFTNWRIFSLTHEFVLNECDLILLCDVLMIKTTK